MRFLVLNVSCCAFAGFFFWKHNMYCESGSEYKLGLVSFIKCNVSLHYWLFHFHCVLPYRLYAFRYVWVSGGHFQHGFPSHGSLGLPESGHHGHFLLWRQKLLKCSISLLYFYVLRNNFYIPQFLQQSLLLFFPTFNCTFPPPLLPGQLTIIRMLLVWTWKQVMLVIWH